MTYSEIKEALKNSGISIENFAFEDYKNPIEGIGEVQEIHQQGGEGEGDHWESVKYFPEHNVYMKVVGRYSSYYGTDFDSDWSEVYEVKPKEKVITVYEG
jgi:hypothetical protein